MSKGLISTDGPDRSTGMAACHTHGIFPIWSYVLFSVIIINQNMPLFSHFSYVTCLGTSLSMSHNINVR